MLLGRGAVFGAMGMEHGAVSEPDPVSLPVSLGSQIKHGRETG